MFDDVGSIVQNPQIRDLGNPAKVLNPPANTALAGRPLVNLSFAINYRLGGLAPSGYHVMNIFFHVMNALLVMGIVRLTMRRAATGLPGDLVGFSAALLWTLHPLNSEVVNYLTQRTESMMAFGYLLALYASIRAHSSTRPLLWQSLAVMACAAGMACKETMVTAPVMLLLYDRVFVFASVRDAFRARGAFYGYLAATWLLLALLLINGQSISAGFSTAHVTPWTYLLNQAVLVSRYLWLAVWPNGLVVYYGWPQALTIAQVWPYALLLTLLLAATVVSFIRTPRLAFLGAWFFVTLAPSSSLVPIATEAGAERRMYLPLAALVTLAVVAGAWVWRRVTPSRRSLATSLAVAALVLVATGFAALTLRRNHEYRSPLLLAETVLARWPTANAQQLVGTELAAIGRHEEAIRYLTRAVDGYPPARYFLGQELYRVGRLDPAIDQLRHFIDAEPHLLAAHSAQVLIGRALEQMGRLAEAVQQGQDVLAESPDDADAHALLADVYAAQEAFEDAIPHYRAFLAERPDDANAWNGLGIALVATGHQADAINAFWRAAAAAPTDAKIRANLLRAMDDGKD